MFDQNTTQDGMADDQADGKAAPDDEVSEEEILQRIAKLRETATRPEGNHTTDRQDALYYYSGDLDLVSEQKDNIPITDGRSSVVSLILAETVETMMPVIMDVVTDSETIAFRRRPGEPAKVAETETEAVRSVIYEQCDGWQVVYDAIWDASVGRYGVAIVGNEVGPDGRRCVTLEAVNPDDVLYVPTARSVDYSPYWGVVYRYTKDDFAAEFKRDPDEFSPAPQTYANRDAAQNSYASIDMGDNVGAIQHYVRHGKGYVVVTTDYMCSEVLDIEHHDCLTLIWFTLYRRPHSLVGWSVYDRVKGSQKIETTVMRLSMDSAQFAQTNRPVLNKNKILPETIGQLATDAPSVPIMVDGLPGEAIGQLYQNQGLPFDVGAMLEQNAANVEARAGVGRNMQGVNADALHDTASVGLQMENRQQMRVRTIARHIAEGPMRKLYEAVHFMARAIGQQVDLPVPAQPQGQQPVPGQPPQPDTQTIDAGNWQPPSGVTAIVDVKGGSEALQAQAAVIRGVLNDVVALQGGPSGQFVQPQNIVNAGRAVMSAAGVADVDDYLPATPAPADPNPPPNPEMMKLQQQDQQAQQQTALQAEQSQAEYTFKMKELALEQQKAQADQAFKLMQLKAEIAQQDRQYQADLELKKYAIDQQTIIAREQMVIDAGKHKMKIDADAERDKVTSDIQLGGKPG